MFPEARKEKLTVRDLPDETLVYDHELHKAHCLNTTARLVWRRCDGQTTVATIARSVAEELGIGHAGEIVRLALQQLGRRHLLNEAVPPLSANELPSRRTALKKLALAAVTLPLVMTVAAKTAAQSASGSSDPAPTVPEVSVSATVALPATRTASSPPCRTKGQSCVATASGQQGTCCGGLKCTGVSQNAGVCG